MRRLAGIFILLSIFCSISVGCDSLMEKSKGASHEVAFQLIIDISSGSNDLDTNCDLNPFGCLVCSGGTCAALVPTSTSLDIVIHEVSRGDASAVLALAISLPRLERPPINS